MKKYYIKISLILFTSLSFSQVAEMDVNSIRAKLIPDGLFFNDTANGSAGFEALKGSGTHTIFSSALWLGGIKTVDSTLCVSKARYANQPDNNFSTGPLGDLQFTGSQENFGGATISPLQTQLWNKVFTITKQEIEIFKAFFLCSKDPLCDANIQYPGYIIPQSIIDWPAHGDGSLLQDSYLAPFYDRDLDGNYDYTQGDFPCIKGDKYAWFVMNDKGNNLNPNYIGAEIQVEVYAFDKDLVNPIDRTIFVGYKIINRSTFSYHDFYAGIFADFDIGCANDDYIGSLPNLNSFFAYNGDNNDGSCGSFITPYGLTPPAQTVTVLNQKLTSSIFISNSGGVINSQTYYNNMQGKHGNGSPMIHFNGDTVKFQYNETGYNNILAWKEKEPAGQGSIPNAVGDRKGVGSVGPYNLNPGDVLQLDVAYIYSRADTGDNLASVAKLQQEIPLVQSFYSDSILPYCSDSLQGTISIDELLEDNISIFPNPFLNSFQIELKRSNSNIKSIELIDVYGKTIYSELGDFKSKLISLDNISKGVYYLKLTTALNQHGVKKIVKR